MDRRKRVRFFEERSIDVEEVERRREEGEFWYEELESKNREK